ncbi:MAG: helix-turn-helix domain-containing protein [Burkholderiales bacterium]|nr:helix-turn-helix domain-containing protein [Burkholderiales bacterium]
MVKIKQTPRQHPSDEADDPQSVRETRFENRRLAALGIEPMTLAELRGRVPLAQLARPERVDFYLLMLVTAGKGRHTVDFVDWPLGRNRLVFVRPGQVQRWSIDERVAAELVLIAPSALPYREGSALPAELELLALDDWSTGIALSDASATEVAENLSRLRREFDRFDGAELDVALIRHELLALLVRLAKLQRIAAADDAGGPARRAIYRLFRRELDAAFTQHHDLRYYAQRLGYAESTLSRACRAAEGRSAKQVIDRRIALEAQRLLVHSTASVAQIAHRLGFSEPTNFVKFFRRTVDRTPSAFRGEATVT